MKLKSMMMGKKLNKEVRKIMKMGKKMKMGVRVLLKMKRVKMKMMMILRMSGNLIVEFHVSHE